MERRQQGSEMVYNKGMGHIKDHKAVIDEDGDGKQMEKARLNILEARKETLSGMFKMSSASRTCMANISDFELRFIGGTYICLFDNFIRTCFSASKKPFVCLMMMVESRCVSTNKKALLQCYTFCQKGFTHLSLLN